MADLNSAQRTALYRTLGNPLRRSILDYLERHGEANSTALAAALGESTGTTSYHLRKLAELNLIEEVAEKSGGRERWWRPLPFSHQTPDPATMTPAEYAAAENFARLKLATDTELYIRALKEYAGPEGWAQVQRHNGAYLAKEDLHAFMRDYLALVERYSRTRADAPEGARRIAFRFFCAPDDPE
ncbi:winged helix-turn-helix domain-containing protein [Actinoallomurus acanthiterrae]